MRRYNSYTPVRSNTTAVKETISESFQHWQPPVVDSDKIDEHEEESGYSGDAQSTYFKLKTSAGEITYNPSDYNNCTDFLRVVIEMSIAFNSSSIDPKFKKAISKAIKVYENDDEFGDEDSTDGEDFDLVQDVIESAKQEAQKMEEAGKFVSNLPKTDTLRLQIFSTDDSSIKHIGKILSKRTDLPPNELHEVLYNNKSFTLPYEAGAELYVQLRMLDVTLSIKSVENEKVVTPPTIKKASAAKKTVAKVASKRLVKKSKTTCKLTGREKLKRADGIISNIA